MSASPDLETAANGDLAAIKALLAENDLPYEDITEEHLKNFVVLRGNGRIIAIGGFEHHEQDGLLRSVAVDVSVRNQRLGKTVVGEVEARASARGVGALYLLTTTAADYFPRLGYQPFDRARVPAAIVQSTEFAMLCPVNAVCLMKRLDQARA